jgi:DNA-binding protein Fis
MKEKDLAPPSSEPPKLYKQFELKLESIVDKMLVLKLGENDNALATVQTMIERVFVTSAMRLANNNISKAARLLGLNRNTLSRKLKEFEPKSVD